MDAHPRDRRLTERGARKGGVVGGVRGVAMARGKREPSERGGDRRRRETRAAGEGERSSDYSRHRVWIWNRREEIGGGGAMDEAQSISFDT